MISKTLLLAGITLVLTAAPLSAARAQQDQELQMAPDSVTLQPEDLMNSDPQLQKIRAKIQLKASLAQIETLRAQLSFLYGSLMQAPIRIEHDVAMADWNIRGRDIACAIAAVTGVRAAIAIMKKQGFGQIGLKSVNGKILWGSVLVGLLTQIAKNHYANDIVLTLQQITELKKEFAKTIDELMNLELANEMLLSQMGAASN